MEYIIREIDRMNYDVAVFSISTRNPFDFLKEIEVKLKESNKSGNIIFDMLTANGNNNRFGTIFFDGKKFIRNSYKDVDFERNSDIRILLNSFYSDNYVSIDTTTLTKALSFLIKNKYVNKF